MSAPTEATAERPMGKVAAYTALTNLALPLTSLATAPILARELGAHGRGEMAAVVAPVFVLMWLANMGLPEAGAYAIAKLRQSPYRVVAHAGRLSLVYGLVAAAGVWFAAPAFLSNMPQMVPLLRSVVVLLPLLMVSNVIRAAALGKREYAAAAVERVMVPLLRLGSFVVLLLLGELTVESATWAQMLCTVTGGAYLVITMLRRREPPDPDATPQRGLTREIALFGLRGWGGVLGNLVTWRFDQVVLVMLVAEEQLGYYVVAVAFSEIGGMAVLAVRGVLFAEAAHRDSAELIARASRVMAALAAVAAIGGSLVATPVIHLMFGAEFAPAIPLACVLLVGSIPFSIAGILAAGVYAQGRPGMISFSQIVAAVVTLVGLVLLAPSMGAMGAAISSVVAYTVSCAITAEQFRRLTGTPIRRTMLLNRDDLHWIRTSVVDARTKRSAAVEERAGASVVEERAGASVVEERAERVSRNHPTDRTPQ